MDYSSFSSGVDWIKMGSIDPSVMIGEGEEAK